jgi:phage shock protein A
MSSLSEKSAFEAFARMEERIENNERMIKASSEIDEEFTGDTLQREFKQLEKGSVSVSVDNQLLALKQKMGMLPAPSAQPNKALGAGQRDEETVHAEIEHPMEEKGK